MAFTPAHFEYHPPTGEAQVQAYSSLRETANWAEQVCSLCMELAVQQAPGPKPELHARVNDVLRAFAHKIELLCPPGSDRDRAYASLRLARLWTNEAITRSFGSPHPERLILEARMWASSAIACHPYEV